MEGTLEKILEQLVDKYSMGKVLELLSLVCEIKAKYIKENWQDHFPAQEWMKMKEYLDEIIEELDL